MMAEQNVNNTIKTTVELDVNKAQQQIVKLNSTASDGTEELSTRLEAKNKQIEIQNILNKKNISDLEKIVEELTDVVGKEKELERAQKKLNKAKLNEVKINTRNAKQQKKLAIAYDDSKSAIKRLDDATGGLLSSFKAIVTNPIGLTITALVGLFSLLKGSVGKSEKATSNFNKIMTKLQGVFNGVLQVLTPVVEFLSEKLLSALNSPVDAIKNIGKLIKENLINRFKALLKIGKSVSLLLDGEFKKAFSLGTDAIVQLATGVEDLGGKLEKMGKKAVENFTKAEKATVNLAEAEKALARNGIALEKQQLKSQNTLEKLRQIRDDITKTDEERLKAAKEISIELDKQSKLELKVARNSLALERAKQAQGVKTVESIQAVGAAEVKLLEIQERITSQRSEQLTSFASLEKEIKDKKDKEKQDRDKKEEEARLAKEAKDKEEKQRLFDEQVVADELEIERLKSQGEKILALELALIEKKRVQDVSGAEKSAKEIDNINKKAKLAKDKLLRAEAEAVKKTKEAEKNLLIKSAGDAFGITQELALATQLLNLPEAIGNVWKNAANQPTIPAMLLHGAVGLATTISPIVKGISQIKSTRFPGAKKRSGGGGAPSVSASTGGSEGAGAGAIPTATTNSVSELASRNEARTGVDTSIGGRATATASANMSGRSSGNVVFSEVAYAQFQDQLAFKEDKSTI